MGGGLIQLSAYGSQDIYLTGNPQITFFKSVYYRHTNFSMESVEVAFNGDPDFGQTVTCTIPKNGDLVHQIYLEVTLPQLDQNNTNGLGAAATYVSWVNSIGHALIKTVEIQIGNEVMDRHHGEWMDIYSNLTIPESKRLAFNNMIGRFSGPAVGPHFAESERTFFIPLQFWFCRNLANSIPLVALQHQDIKLKFSFRQLRELIKSDKEISSITSNSAAPTLSASLYVNYIYLDNKERRRFVSSDHEYLIEQVQYDGEESISLNASNFSANLSYSHPIKEIIWTITKEDNYAINYSSTGNDIFNHKPSSSEEFLTANLKFNGINRFNPRKPDYFKLVQPFEHHTYAPGDKYIYVYSFAMKPEENQPSGTCNMSMVDQASLNFTFPSSISASFIKIYAVNYNILRVVSGMSGLAFNN
jgi:hypothetical protein